MEPIKKTSNFFSKKRIIFSGLALVIILAAFFYFRNGSGAQTTLVVRTDIIQEVAATGKVKPNQSVNLGFDKSGRVGASLVGVGESVKAGQTIALLEAGETEADLAKARAALQEENIKLRELQSTTPVSYGDAAKNLAAAVRESFAAADNAVRNRTDQFFKSIPDNPQFQISITSGNFVNYFNVPDDAKIEINGERKKVEEILSLWQKRNLNTDPAGLIKEADAAISDLNFIASFLDKIARAVNSFAPAEYSYETTVNNYKLAVSSARSEVSGAVSSMVTAKGKFTTAGTLGETGEFEDVLAQEARVKQAEAVVSSFASALGKSSIRAPFDGVVTLQDAKVGGAVTAGAALVSVISQNESYIEANISEIHIGKILVGNAVSVSFDAFPNEEFLGEISYIEPGDVLVDGVVNYKVRATLTASDPKIKSGLTANLKIQTARKENVLAVPLYAVQKVGDQNFVNKVVGKTVQKTLVVLGLSGNNGLTEVLDGLNEGDLLEF